MNGQMCRGDTAVEAMLRETPRAMGRTFAAIESDHAFLSIRGNLNLLRAMALQGNRKHLLEIPLLKRFSQYRKMLVIRS